MNDDRTQTLAELETSLASARSEIERMRELHAAAGGAFGVVPIQSVLQAVVDEATLFENRYGVDDRAEAIGAEARKLMDDIPSIFKPKP